MIRKKMLSCLMALCTLLTCSISHLSAVEEKNNEEETVVLAPQEEKNNEEETVVLTPKEEMMIHDYRLSILPEGFAVKSHLSASTYEDDSQYFYRIHPDAYYYAVGVTATGDNVLLHDGSIWYVHPHQRHIVKKWVQSDLLFIKPKSSCFSMYSYVLHNRVTHDAVEVNVISPAIETGAATFWIAGIDSYNRLVYLNDGTVWYISDSEYAFNKWQVGHRLIIGVNNYWRMAKYPHILINTSIYNAPYCEADIAL